MRRTSGITLVAALIALLIALEPASGITTTESLVEATHTTLPVAVLDDTAGATTRSGDLTEAESKDPQRLEIIKQIRKVNQDGSYTVGYEADDGTFKIESRDVLGNVKGTYGYIDANGDIKRVSYGGGARGAQTTAAAVTPVMEEEEDIVHIPPRFNRSQHQLQLLVPTTRRPPNYQPPVQQNLHHHNPHHASTLRPSVIQTIPRKRSGYAMTTTSTTTSTTTTAATAATAATATTMPATAGSATSASTATGATSALMTTPEPTTEMPSSRAAYSEQSTASSHTAPLHLHHHTKPAGGGLLIIRPTPLPYQTVRAAEQQLARPERLVDSSPPKFIPASHPPAGAKKTPAGGVRGNFLRRQLAPAAAAPGTAGDSGEQFDQQHQPQHQTVVYGHQPTVASGADGPDGGGELYGRPLYTTHPSPRIPAAVLAARQRAAHIQSVLQSQQQQQQQHGHPATSPTTERIYVRQPVRPAAGHSAAHSRHHEPAASIVYEPSTEPSSENSAYVTDSPVQVRSGAAIASETEPEPEERPRPAIFRPRPTLEYRPPAVGGPRYRTPYGLPPPPPPFGRPFGAVAGGDELDEIGEVGGRDRPEEAAGQPLRYDALVAPYPRQQRRLPLPAAAAAADTPQQQQQQQPQNAYPIPVPHYPGGGGAGRLPPSPYYYDIPAERPLTARDFERILQVLIYRHQQLQFAQQQYPQAYRYPGYGPGAGGGGGGVGVGGLPGYHGVGVGGFPGYNPYYPSGPSVAPFGLGGSYNAPYPQQQIPRPPLPFPYGGHPAPYDGGYFQNPLYSPSAPSPSAVGSGRADPASEHQPSAAAGGYGLTASRRQGQYYGPPLAEIPGGSTAATNGRSSNGDFLPPEVRESLLYRMLMLAIQAPGGSGEVLPPLATTATGLAALQGASSMPLPNVHGRGAPQTLKPDAAGGASTVAAAATMTPMYSKKPVRSVQILGEE